MMRAAKIVLLAVVACSFAQSLAAQRLSEIRPGTRIRIWRAESVVAREGIFRSLSADSLLMTRVADGDRLGVPVRVPLVGISRLQVREIQQAAHRGRTTLIGVLIGAAMGTVVAATTEICDADGCHSAIVIGGATAGFIGGLLASNFQSYAWRDVRLGRAVR